MLLAKNYYGLEDSFQAIFVLDSLIENFKIYPELVKEAQSLIVKYQSSLKEENRSIDKNDEGG